MLHNAQHFPLQCVPPLSAQESSPQMGINKLENKEAKTYWFNKRTIVKHICRAIHQFQNAEMSI